MVFIGLILLFAVPLLLCWIVFSLAIYALPLFVGITAAIAASHHQVGAVGIAVVGMLAAAACLLVGQIAFATCRSVAVRGVIGLAYAVPAALAGYSSTLAISHFAFGASPWCVAFAGAGAVAVGATAFFRLAAAPPHSVHANTHAAEPDKASGASVPPFAAASHG